jgi:heme A synthase
MDTEMIQTNEYDEVNTETLPAELPAASEPVIVQDTSANELSTNESFRNESVEESWRSIQAQLAEFFAHATSYTTAFFKNNQQLLTTLGWVLLALLSARLLLGALDAFDDIPLVSPLLKLIGFVYVVQFVWRYLIRERNRQELLERFKRAKAEMFGSES